jgi:hypothetical protein
MVLMRENGTKTLKNGSIPYKSVFAKLGDDDFSHPDRHSCTNSFASISADRWIAAAGVVVVVVVAAAAATSRPLVAGVGITGSAMMDDDDPSTSVDEDPTPLCK